MTPAERAQIRRWADGLTDPDPAVMAACARLGRLLAGDAA